MALARSFQWLLGRHESLRTRFVETAEACAPGDRGAGMGLELPLQHLLQAPIPSRPCATSSRPAARRCVDLQQVPLYASTCCVWLLVMTQHHIVSDGWSMQVLVEELVHAYQSRRWRTSALGGGIDPVHRLRDLAAGGGGERAPSWAIGLRVWAVSNSGAGVATRSPAPAAASHRGERLGGDAPADLRSLPPNRRG
ncbi:condensation domain-containing protein [Pseudomonas sp. BNK-44-a]|uniref:condensation domain-containing protein n=1 Tax=Pseudomonas sp. BNK-44-a TaxID=3376178 RepID=UPI0039BFE8CC